MTVCCSLPNGGLGNPIALPLQGKSLRQGSSAFVAENWNVYDHLKAKADHIFSLAGQLKR